MLIGLIALLFVVTFVHTIGILNISEEVSNVPADSQKAQVATLSICLQVTPLYNIVEPGEYVTEGLYPAVTTYMYFNIKNLCTATINIFNPGVGYTTPTLQNLQTRQANGNPMNILSPQHPNYNINYYAEFVECFNCSNGTLTYPSTAVGTPPTVYVHPIAPQQTRTIIFTNVTGMTDVSEWPIRVAPKAIKWIAQSALTNGQVQQGEIITTPIPATNAATWASDFIEPAYEQ